MATRKEIQFRSKINKLLKDADKLDAQALRRTNQLLFDMKKRINARLANEALEGWDLTHLPRLKIAMNQVVSEFQRQYNNALNSFTTEAFEKGIELVDEPMRIAYETFALPELSRQTLGIMQGYSADLVVGVSNDVRRWINSELTLGITGEKSPFQIMQGIGKKVKGYAWEKGTPMDKAMRRAEVITRTEISRVLNLSTWKRQEQLSENYPETKKYWIQFPSKYPRDVHRSVMNATNPASGGTPIPINQDYIVGTERAKAPHDPRLSAKNVIQCGCRSVIWMPEFEIEKEIEKIESIDDVRDEIIKKFDIERNNIKELNDIESLKILRDQLSELKKEGYNFNYKFIDTNTKGNEFASSSKLVLSLNKKWFNNVELFKRRIDKSIKDGWTPRGCNKIKAIITHEFAHSLTRDALDFKLVPSKEFSKIKSEYSKFLNKAIKNKNKEEWNVNFISEYAKTNIHEFVAESFMMYKHSNNPSPYAMRIGKLIDKHFKSIN